MLTVRAARTDDLGAIVNLERYCFPPEVAFGRSRWHYLLAHAKGAPCCCWMRNIS